jgi:hypothetical protein
VLCGITYASDARERIFPFGVASRLPPFLSRATPISYPGRLPSVEQRRQAVGGGFASGGAASASGGAASANDNDVLGEMAGDRAVTATSRRGKKGASRSTSSPSSPRAPQPLPGAPPPAAPPQVGFPFPLQPPPPSIDGFWLRSGSSSELVTHHKEINLQICGNLSCLSLDLPRSASSSLADVQFLNCSSKCAVAFLNSIC